MNESGTLTVDGVLTLLVPLVGKSGLLSTRQWEPLADCLVSLLNAGFVPTDFPTVLGTGTRPVAYPGITGTAFHFEPFVRQVINLPHNWTLQTTSPDAETHEAVYYAPNGPADRRIPFIPRGPLYSPLVQA